MDYRDEIMLMKIQDLRKKVGLDQGFREPQRMGSEKILEHNN